MSVEGAALGTDEGPVDFSGFDLDPRINRVLEKINICKPTLIQEKAIPLALAGKDLLAKARTGSGKTLAYLLPILQGILTTSHPETIRALILVPTKELARQIADTITIFLHYFPREVTSLNLAGEESHQLQKSMLSTNPTLLVATPSRLLPHLDAKVVDLGTLEYLVIDEADLVLSFGYTADVERLGREFIPKTVQTFLMSATLSPEMESLKQLVLRNPVILKLDDADDDSSQLQQFILRCEPDDKFLLLYVTLKLKLLRGKLLIFTNDVDRCFRLKLFLEQFGIKTCVLNPELPVASRHHIVDEFNRGVYDIIIASDLQPTAPTATAAGEKKEKRKRSEPKSDKEGGVARGVDFKRVDVVINFDLPQRVDSYVHRVGRTARGGNAGIALSLISTNDDERVLAAISADQEIRGNSTLPHGFDLKQLDGFRYRCGDALRAVTKIAIKTARLQAIKQEIIKSDKLKAFFAERPRDLSLLRHDKSSGTVAVKAHMKHIPEYLLPAGGEIGEESGKRVRLGPLLPQDDTERPYPARKFGERKPSSSTHFKRNRNPLKKVKKGSK